jgi:PPOX class probable F420-dependent enzyme
MISSREPAMKTHNIRRHGRAWVCVFPDRFLGEWVQAEGAASVESLPDAMEALVRYYKLVAGEHPDWDDYRRAMVREKRVLIRIQIDRVGPIHQG